MTTNETLAILALKKVKGLGDINAKKLISYFGSASEIFKLKKHALEKLPGIGTYIAGNFQNKEIFINAEKELAYIQKNNVSMLYFEDEAYPTKLKHCADGPIVMFQKGKINFKNQPIISIVGTRNISSYGKQFCEQLISDLKPFNPIVVSGFAYGIDICAQLLAVKHQLQTIGVLAHGFEEMYPKPHAKYTASIVGNGGFFTEFFHKEQPMREYFLKRNRIVAGMSSATIVVESASKGGSLVTADIANSYNRDVFAVPGRVTDTYSKGCNNLIKHHQAAVLTSSKDLIKALNWDVSSKKPKHIQQQLFISFSEEEEKIYNYLAKDGKQLLDTISLTCEYSIQNAATILFNLEMKGAVRPLPGKVYEAI